MISIDHTLIAAATCFGEGPVVRRWMQRNRPRICPFERLVNLVPPGACVLDVGCGDGLFLGLLALLGEQVSGVGFDPSAPAIASAAAMAERIHASSRLRFVNINGMNQWPRGQFDVVSVIDVLHHVPRSAQRNVIEMAASQVKPGGILLYKDIAGGPAGFMNRLHDLLLARQIIHYVTPEKIAAWVAPLSFTLTCAEDIRMWWYPHLLRVFRRTAL